MEINHAVSSGVFATAGAVVPAANVQRPEINTLQSIQSVDQPKTVTAPSTTVTLSSLRDDSESGVVEGAAEPTGAEAELMKSVASGSDSDRQTDIQQSGNENDELKAEDTQVRNGRELTEEQVQVVERLQTRDREVRAHEQAHANVGGAIAGAPSYDFSRGPDGRLYATAGEVSIDTSSVAGDPRATIEKMRTVISAASAPAEPSGADRQVAAKAAAILAEAVSELGRLESQQNEELKVAQDEDAESTQTEQEESTKNSLELNKQSTENQDKKPDFEAFFNSPFPPDPDLISSLDQIVESRNNLNELLIRSGVYDRTFPSGSVIENLV